MQIEGNQQLYQDENQRLFTDYLSRQPITNYHDFTFDIDEYRTQYPEAAQQLIKDPSKYYVLIKKYLEKSLKDGALKPNKQRSSKVERFNIKIEGNLGANFVTPRGLSSRMANELVGLQGIITKMELTQHYLEKSVQYCPKTKAIQQREYPDSFNPQKDNELNRGRMIRNYDDQNNPLEFEYGLSSFKNSQIVVIQELPEMAPPGLLPMSVQVVLQSHLVNSVKPGDRVQMVGIYKLIAGMVSKQKGIFRPFFICLSIKPLTYVSPNNKIPKKEFKKEEIFDLFSRSIAPSVWGHEYLKKAVLLMLVGGVEKNLDNGTHLRGDINLLMIGDPGTAKSQMLRWILTTVDVSVGTTGSGASGVGLTAAIVSDKISGQKTLQAGAMVLADRGVVCIDQFDKMNQIDRVAVHEVMEQQTVTIAKAGLHCSLNARCSVVAAANPIYGEYQRELPPTKNIGMPDSLLSRFDLIFLIFDEKKPQRDRQIAQKVCRNHRLAPQFNDFLNQFMDAEDYVVNPVEETKVTNQIYERNNVYRGQGKDEILSQPFLKNYINYVKQNVIPELTDDAVYLSAAFWNLLRQKDMVQKDNKMTKVLPVTIRTHESLIRLSTAHAKLLQMPYVEAYNVIQAFRLIVFCLYSAEDQLDKDINEILIELKIDYNLEKDRKLRLLKREELFEEKEQQHKKMEPQQEKIIQGKLSKISMRKDQSQADQILKKHIDVTFDPKQKSLVYKKFSDLMKKKKGNEKFLTFDELFEEVKAVIKSKQKLDAILKQLQQKDNKIGTEDGRIFAV